jgi:hypothetical protein
VLPTSLSTGNNKEAKGKSRRRRLGREMLTVRHTHRPKPDLDQLRNYAVFPPFFSDHHSDICMAQKSNLKILFRFGNSLV